jgi:O-antigen biosynthesis protein
MQRPKVAIVIPTADQTREPAATAIARARATTAHLGATVHVVESSGPGFRFSRSVNRGIAQAPDADAWVLLNDDCFMDDGWLDAMLDTMRSHPEAGLVGAVLRFPNGRLQHAGGFALKPLLFLAQYTKKFAPFHALRRIRRARVRGHAYVGHFHSLRRGRRLDLVTGACLLITRVCHARIGGFDEEYEFSMEDVDYNFRALEAGLDLALALDATGEHTSRATGGGLRPQITRSEARFFAQWPTERVRKVTRAPGRRGVFHGRSKVASCACLQAPATSTTPA